MKDSSILFVDDEQNILSAMARELRDYNYSPMLATSGAEALEIIASHPCKVIIADMKMTPMSGLELLKKVKESSPYIIRIVLSGHADIKLILDIVNQEGIDRYLTKPWQIEDVLLAIRQSIELYDLRQEIISLRSQLS